MERQSARGTSRGGRRRGRSVTCAAEPARAIAPGNRALRLSVRTQDFQSCKRGSTPLGRAIPKNRRWFRWTNSPDCPTRWVLEMKVGQFSSHFVPGAFGLNLKRRLWIASGGCALAFYRENNPFICRSAQVRRAIQPIKLLVGDETTYGKAPGSLASKAT